MKFYNINNKSERVTLKEAVLKSAGRVTGLYMPETIPVMPSLFFEGLNKMSLAEIAFEITRAMLGKDIPITAIESIIKEALNFKIPLVQLDENIFALELFHGPTFAFKDVGARFMASLFEYFVQSEDNELTVLVATSGDTGSAVANAFYNKQGVRVVILYPSGKVSAVQEKQLTTLKGNITAFEVDGTFDDCQRLVKLAFADAELNGKFRLASANSINFARLFPQSFYYFHGLGQLKSMKPAVISVPCGNFGNLTAGLLAKKMGLKVFKFIAASNSNHAVVDYLESGQFRPHASLHTLTNAMDVGNPSNFQRILELYDNQHHTIRDIVKGFWFTDAETIDGLEELQNKYEYQADPHATVAYLGLLRYIRNSDCAGIFLGTAHPAKFSSDVEKATGKKVPVPELIKKLEYLEKDAVMVPNDFECFKELLISSLL